MKAVVCSEYGAPEGLQVASFATPEPAEGQVLLDVKSAGVTFVDTLTIQNRHQNPHPLPFVPGMEVAGTVLAHGPGVAPTTPAPGERVAALVYDGGYAERVCATSSEVFPLPDEVPYETAAGCLSVYLTAFLALHEEARLDADETLLVTGAGGGVGLAAVDVAAVHGAQVVACASSADKRDAACAHGAASAVDNDPEQLRDAVRTAAPGGVDVVLDVVGAELGEATFRTLGWGGRYVSVGFAGGGVPKFAANLLLVKNRAVLGFALMHYRRQRRAELQRAAAEIFGGIASGSLRPLIREVGGLGDAPRFLRDIMNRTSTGKTVLRLD